MKKSISIFLAIICITGLSGCGSKKNEALTAPPPSKSVEKSQNTNKNDVITKMKILIRRSRLSQKQPLKGIKLQPK